MSQTAVTLQRKAVLTERVGDFVVDGLDVGYTDALLLL